MPDYREYWILKNSLLELDPVSKNKSENLKKPMKISLKDLSIAVIKNATELLSELPTCIFNCFLRSEELPYKWSLKFISNFLKNHGKSLF